ncbi:G2/mitotic-specific cyclin-B [Chionoecetes opilio]|uniref:G2/mitotic-specific cyclin-B n=1 Tax=Chionoecetes opilio TaxID=41210 RepID=A0A8J5CGZ8_CHIOP|nr:G2/mitotic-specific cyclin-B [Chionoecetes opilio]
MALRARQLVNMAEPTNGPRKVEAKVFQGPTLQRAALGEMSNRNFSHLGLKSTKSIDITKLKAQQPAGSGAPAAQPRKEFKVFNQAQKRHLGKENAVKGVAEQVKEAKKEVREEVQEDMDGSEMEVEELAVAFSTQRLNVEDIDAQDANNPQLVSEYVCDIYDYLRTLEQNSPVHQRYLEGQTITTAMRAILIDWLVQGNLFLTVGILDRYLQSERNVARNKLQLVGVTAMFIASKFEEMLCPDVGDFTYITDKAYTKREILRMEIKLLKQLKFNISFPLPLHFLRRNSKAGMVDSKHHTLGKYLLELCLPEYSMCHFKPSVLAAAALCLTLRLLDGGEWNDTLIYHSTYTEDKLMPVMCKMAAVVVKSHHSKQQAVRQKYDTTKFMKISKLPELKSEMITKLAERSALS